MKRLIVNADDFGLTRGVNAGIIRAFESGIVTSTSIMANGDAFEHAIELAGKASGLAVGCHLVLVGGKPLARGSDISSLLERDGTLPKTITSLIARLATGRVMDEHIDRELRAQVQRVAAHGVKLSHLDTHKHVHTNPRLIKALVRIAREFKIKCVRNPFEDVFCRPVLGPAARANRSAYLRQYAMAAAAASSARSFKRLIKTSDITSPDYFIGVSLTGLLDEPALEGLFGSLRDGTTELMCHPGICDDELERAPTRLKRERQRELQALTSPGVRRAIDELGVKLISYHELG